MDEQEGDSVVVADGGGREQEGGATAAATDATNAANAAGEGHEESTTNENATPEGQVGVDGEGATGEKRQGDDTGGEVPQQEDDTGGKTQEEEAVEAGGEAVSTETGDVGGEDGGQGEAAEGEQEAAVVTAEGGEETAVVGDGGGEEGVTAGGSGEEGVTAGGGGEEAVTAGGGGEEGVTAGGEEGSEEQGTAKEVLDRELTPLESMPEILEPTGEDQTEDRGGRATSKPTHQEEEEGEKSPVLLTPPPREDGNTVTTRLPPQQPDEVVMIDGVPVLQDIAEEDEEEREETAVVDEEVSKEELLDILKGEMEENARLQELSLQVQQRIAEHLATRKSEEDRGEQGSNAFDHKKEYAKLLARVGEVTEEVETVMQECKSHEAEQNQIKKEKLDELNKAKAEFTKYRREKLLNCEDHRNGRKVTAKVLDTFFAAEEKKEDELVQVRLESIKLQNKITKLEASIKDKEQVAGGLHMIDFEQMKINTVDLNEKIEERNDELLKLKKKVTSTVEVLTHVKEKLQFLQVENAKKKEELRDIDALVAKKRDHLTRLKQARDSLRSDNLRLKQKGGLIGHTALLQDFEEKQDQREEMQARLEQLQKRYSELTVMCDGLKKKIEHAKQIKSRAQ